MGTPVQGLVRVLERCVRVSGLAHPFLASCGKACRERGRLVLMVVVEGQRGHGGQRRRGRQGPWSRRFQVGATWFSLAGRRWSMMM